MIHLTRLNQVPLVLNSDLIEHIEMTPDTVISLTSGQKLVVRETCEEIIERVIEFRRSVLQGLAAYNWPVRHVNQDVARNGSQFRGQDDLASH